MISFFDKGIKNVFPTRNIDIHELVTMIMFNPQEETIIQIRDLREKNLEYKHLKKTLPYFTPNCSVKKRSLKGEEEFNKNFLEFSGYFFLDIDVSSNVPEFKENMINKYKEIATLICYSSSRGGISILVKVTNTITKENFHLIYDRIVSEYFKDEKIDPSAKDIGRAWFLTYDKEPYFNPNNSITIDELKESIELVKPVLALPKEEGHEGESTREGGKQYYNTHNTQYTLNSPHRNFKYQHQEFRNIRYQTLVPVENPVVDIGKKLVSKLWVPAKIRDGQKHKIYKAIIHTFVELNKDLPERYVYSFLHTINSSRAEPPMGKGKLNNLIQRNLNEINNPNYTFKNSKSKKIHFNSDHTLPEEVKKIIAVRLNGKLRNNRTIDAIQLAKRKIELEGKVPTIKGVARITGFDRNTVRSNFEKPLNDIQAELEKINEEYSNFSIQNYFNTAISMTGSFN